MPRWIASISPSSDALDGLDRAQRLRVVRTVRRGEAADSLELANPLVAYASASLRWHASMRVLRIVSLVLVVCGAVLVLLGSVGEGDLDWLDVAPVAVVAALVAYFVVDARRQVLVEQSMRATENRWGLGSGPVKP
ncbi:hypothetical protein [Kibdelosporangium phytohabitans]|uniref:Uncharacterized protein n=1 Tax=Kibdelosporangium phytohabitans TaxID=860235 RepID=A0A0N9I9J0_9PSEU|nr:hypothetical protein [Kibdelosporangium phytohabitans]ALG11619.1 hypothetical protein AOZ06_36355 [Kibdelosporangium phytohabitans]MBE1462994.1 putative membrane protein YfcA [Kibdelosporangium phytohabitans]